MYSRWILISIFITLFFLSFCDNAVSNNKKDIYARDDFIGAWGYGDTCLLWAFITYTFTDSICIKTEVPIDSVQYKKVLNDGTVFEKWLAKNDSLLLLVDSTNINNLKNEIYRFQFIDDNSFLLSLNNTGIWLEFRKNIH
jgi:hypothetical protein